MFVELKTIVNFFNTSICSNLVKKEIIRIYCNYGNSITKCFKKGITNYLNINNYSISNFNSSNNIKTDYCYQKYDLQPLSNINPNIKYSSIMLNDNISNRDDIIIYITMFSICILTMIYLISITINKYFCRNISFRKYKRYKGYSNINIYVDDVDDY
jgi:hypothetical protein